MGALKVGDVVFDEAGRLCNVTATFDEMPERAYRLTFSDGSSIEAGGEHQWVTWTHAERKSYLRSGGRTLPDNWPTWKSPSGIGPQIRTTDEIAATEKTGKRGDTNHSVPVAGALQLPKVQLLIDPYILGLLLGDGSSATGEITCHDDDASFYARQFRIVGEGWKFARRRDADKPTATYTIGKREPQRGLDGRMKGNGSITSRLRELGILGNKAVPETYLRSSAHQRLALLQGLMDTDGGWSGKTVEFCNTNKALADAVVELARSLGQKPVIKESRATLYGKDCGARWRVTWRPTVQVFRLPRKAERFQYGGAQSSRHVHRMIRKIDHIELKPMRCITVDSPNSMYLAGEAMVPTHNTRAGAEWVLDQVWNQGKKRIALIARTPADARDVMIYGDSGIMACSDPHERPLHEPTKRRLIWPNGAQAFTYSAAAPAQLRGPQHDAAWCFIAGTLITTPFGQVPIEQLTVGEVVKTRHGIRKIVGLQRRLAPVGIVEFSNGQRLIGTGEHPVLTSHGWTRLDQLQSGQTVICAGDQRPTATSQRIAEARRSTSIATFGSSPTVQSLMAGTSTIVTETRPTTTLPILKQLTQSHIEVDTWQVRNNSWWPALTVESQKSESLQRSDSLSAHVANNAGQTPKEPHCGTADIAAKSSTASRELCVASVVSTWQDVGSDYVYNLTIAGEHEYIANGIVVHNCDETAAWFDARKGDVLDTSWNNLMLGLRLGEQPQCFVTTTPKRVRLIREIMERNSTVITTDTTYANLKNLASSFKEQVVAAYEGTRIGRQELMGELLTDVDGALWTLDTIDNLRVELT